jgi:hypothetical protein
VQNWIVGQPSLRGRKRVWLVVAILGAVLGLFTLAVGLMAGRPATAVFGGALLAFSLYSLYFSQRRFR